MGASPGLVGTARAQLYLRLVLSHAHARLLPPPELLVAAAHQRFDPELRLTHEATRHVLRQLLERFVRWIERERVAEEAERRAAHRA
jgi:chromate reductase